MKWPVAFLTDSIFIVNHAGPRLENPGLKVYFLKHYISAQVALSIAYWCGIYITKNTPLANQCNR